MTLAPPDLVPKFSHEAYPYLDCSDSSAEKNTDSSENTLLLEELRIVCKPVKSSFPF